MKFPLSQNVISLQTRQEKQQEKMLALVPNPERFDANSKKN